MRIEPNEYDEGSTVICVAGDSLNGVPPTHRPLLSPAIRQVFSDPRGHFREVAQRCRFPKMAEWLRAVTEPNQWELHLFQFEDDDAYSQAGFYWRAPPVRDAFIAPSRRLDLCEYPADVQRYYSLVDFVKTSGFGAAGGLDGAGDFLPLARICDQEIAGIDLEKAYLWGDSPSGDRLFFTADGRAGWYKLGARDVRYLGTFAESVDFIYSGMLVGEGPDAYRKGPGTT